MSERERVCERVWVWVSVCVCVRERERHPGGGTWSPALSQSFWVHQFGEPRLFSAPKLKDVFLVSQNLQGYLSHKKQRRPRTLQLAYA